MFAETIYTNYKNLKEKVLVDAISHYLKRPIENVQEADDFLMVQDSYGGKKWWLHKGKTFGYLLEEANWGEGKIRITFHFEENPFLDRKIREDQEAEEAAKKAEQERQDKLWGAVKTALEPMFHYTAINYPAMIVDRLKECGFKLSMEK